MTARLATFLLLSVLVLLCPSQPASADALLVPLDNAAETDPSTYGYTVKTSTLNDVASITITLTPDAAAAFRSADLTLTHDGKELLITSLALKDADGGTKFLQIIFHNTQIIDGGEIRIWSGERKGKPVMLRNFAGFRLSINKLFAQAKKVEEAK